LLLALSFASSEFYSDVDGEYGGYSSWEGYSYSWESSSDDGE